MRKHRAPRLAGAVSDPPTFARCLSSVLSVCSSEPGAEAQGERARENKKAPGNPGLYCLCYLCSEKINQWDSTRAPLETQGGIDRQEKLSRLRKQSGQQSEPIPSKWERRSPNGQRALPATQGFAP